MVAARAMKGRDFDNPRRSAEGAAFNHTRQSHRVLSASAIMKKTFVDLAR
jgi:hypothetical protein